MAACVLFRTARTLFPTPKLYAASNFTNSGIHLWAFLNPIFNSVDNDRVKECGPDRVAAEWIVRCGGAVRWRGLEKYHKDYNTLPGGRMVLEAIDATDSCIMDVGFGHLKGLEHLEEINLTSCHFINDNALRVLAMYQKEHLKNLRIVSCGSITDAGLAYLVEMKALQSLIMAKLVGVDNPEKCVKLLRDAHPECRIEFLTSEQLAER